MRTALAALAAAVGLALPAAVPHDAAQATTEDTSPTLTVVNALPGTPVDVANTEGVLFENVQPGDTDGPLEVPAGDYEISFVAPGAFDGENPTTPLVGPALVSLDDADAVSVVAHLDENGEPTVSSFTEDLSETQAPLAGRLVVRNAAGFAPVDVMVGERTVFTGLASGMGDAEDMEVGDYTLNVVDAGTQEPATVPIDVLLEPGMVTVVYLTGSEGDDIVDHITMQFEAEPGTGTLETPTASASPSATPSPDMSATPDPDMTDADDGSSSLWWWIIGGAVLVALAIGVGVAMSRRKSDDPNTPNSPV